MAYSPDTNVTKSRILQDVNLLVPGNTLVYSIPAGFLFLPVGDGRFIMTNVAGTGLGTFTVSAGTNATSYNNLYSAVTPALLSITTGLVFKFSDPVQSYSATSADIYLRVSGAATGFTTLRGVFYLPYILVPIS
jgi:hypothetical protein